MNDFTKEELEEILMWSSHLAGCRPYLIKKLQSMIDNYNDEKKNIYILIGSENSYEASHAIAASVDRQVVQDVEKQFMSDNPEGWAYIIEFKDGEY